MGSSHVSNVDIGGDEPYAKRNAAIRIATAATIASIISTIILVWPCYVLESEFLAIHSYSEILERGIDPLGAQDYEIVSP